MTDADRAATNLLVGRLLLASAAFIGVLAVVLWTGAIPLDERVRPLLTIGAVVAALVDLLLAAFFLWKASRRREDSTRS